MQRLRTSICIIKNESSLFQNEQKEVRMEDKKKETQHMSSKDRKLAKKKEIAHAKRKALISRLVTISVISLVCIGLATLIGFKVYRNLTKVTPSSDYSAYLTDNGFIEGVTATSYVNIGDYKNIKVPASEVEYTDKELNSALASAVFEHTTLDKETDAAIVDGDNINIDFVGTIDGQEFDNGNTDGKGADLTIGSETYIDDFEQQLIGHKVGETVTVDVTFPTDYSDATLAGKDASFEVVINGIYPALTDDIIKKNYSDNAKTVEEYKNYLKLTNYDKKLTAWLEKTLVENATVSSYPEDYTDHLKSIQKQMDLDFFEYANSYYLENFGQELYASFDDYTQKSEAKYDESLKETSKATAKANLVYQAILESEGVTVSDADYLAYLKTQDKTQDDFDNEVETYGKGYVLQQMVKTKAIELAKTYVTVE
jgi:trigger factor